jgi:uroporphyrinogen-III synthase
MRALPRGCGVVFFSPSAVDAFLDALADAADDDGDDRCDQTARAGPRVRAAVCVGGSTARAWNARSAPPAVAVARGKDVVAAVVALHAGEAVTGDDDDADAEDGDGARVDGRIPPEVQR